VKSTRTILFWAHLVVGVAGGLVIMIMSATGVLLTYEKQMLEWADRRSWTAPSSVEAQHLSPETLLANVMQAQPGAAPTSLVLRADPAAPATVTLDGGAPVLVDPYTGVVIGRTSSRLRTFFRTVTVWHRFLALEGANRATGRLVTGAANLGFLFIVLSGLYLWMPKVWGAVQVRNALWFRTGLPGKARDFNWHNVIGFWSALPLAVVVAGAVPISFPWASNLVYRLVGDAPPRPGGPGRVQTEGDGLAVHDPAARFVGVNAAWSQAARESASWRTITLRLARAPEAPFVFAVDSGYGGQPQKRVTVTVNRASAAIEKREAFDDLTPGRRLRSWLRFAHTGEIYGLPGQTVAGLVSAGAVVLVYTGLALAFRRFTAWLVRSRARPPAISRAT